MFTEISFIKIGLILIGIIAGIILLIMITLGILIYVSSERSRKNFIKWSEEIHKKQQLNQQNTKPQKNIPPKKSSNTYKNCFSNGKKFSQKRLKEFQEKRERNNPNNEPVGTGTERCHFCGYKRKNKIFSSNKSDNKKCANCSLIVEYY